MNPPLYATLAITALLTACLGAQAAISPRDAVYKLDLQNAIGPSRALQLTLDCRDGKFVAGVASNYAKVFSEVDSANLMLEGQALKGELLVRFEYDGYLPSSGQTLRAKYQIDANVDGTAVSGKFTGPALQSTTQPSAESVSGTLSGTLVPRPTNDGLRMIELCMENAHGAQALSPAIKPWGARAYPIFIYKDGRAIQSLNYGHGGRSQVQFFESVITENAIKWEANRFSGPLTVVSSDGQQTYVYDLKGQVAGDRLAGTYTKKLNGKQVPSGPFSGTISPVPVAPPDTAVYYLDLHNALGHKHVLASIPCEQGKWFDGLAYAGTYNHSYHDVLSPVLKRQDNKLSGQFKVRLNPDAYVPADHKAVDCVYQIDATIADGCITGTHTGKYGSQDVSGKVFGRLLPIDPVPDPVHIGVKLEDGVVGGAPWFRRTFINFVAQNGKADKGGISNNKKGWFGTFKNASVNFEGSKITATIEGTVDTTSGPKVGQYLFKLEGRRVGQSIYGKVETWLDGQKVKTGTDFMGSFGPPPAK